MILILFIPFLYSCNFTKNDLLGKYIIEKIQGDTVSQNYLKEIHLLKKNKVMLIYRDNFKIGKWYEHSGLDYHYIEIFANNSSKELEIYENMKNDDSRKLNFIGSPTDFQGGYYDSLSFVQVKSQ